MRLTALFVVVLVIVVTVPAAAQTDLPRMQPSCAPPGQWIPRVGPSGPYLNCEAVFIPPPPLPVVVQQPVVVYQPAPVYVPAYGALDSAAAIRYWLATGVNPNVGFVPFPVASPCFGGPCVSVNVGVSFPIGGHRHRR